MLTFRFVEDPDSEFLEGLASEADWPCVWCETFLRSSAPKGSKVVAFTVENDGRLAAVALGIRTSSLRNRQLVFPSYPRWLDSDPEVSREFWQGLQDYWDKLNVAKFQLNSYEAPASLDWPFGEPLRVHERKEYYIDLSQDLDALFKCFSSNHRRNVRKAERQDFVCDIDRSETAFERHLSVFSHTQARRSERGESAAGINASLCRNVLASGDGFLMQLRHADEIVSSFLVLLTSKRAFYYSGGTTEQGMRMGASHYLMWLAIRELKARGATTLSLGGISGTDPEGLARYKLGFGATAVALSNVSHVTGRGFGDGALRRVRPIGKWTAAKLRALRNILRFKRWVLYSWTPRTAREISLPEGKEVRRLFVEDFKAMEAGGGRLADQARLYFFGRGITSAYGLFVEGRLAHISWVYTAEEYAREPVEQLKLADKEAEITNCFTLEEFRGQGLYAFAIGCISKQLFEQGFERVYMKTEADNTASQKGILKAGLKSCGTSYHLSSPALLAWKGRNFTTSR
jgi:RimJ/RimL family protein N-acetyltransferase